MADDSSGSRFPEADDIIDAYVSIIGCSVEQAWLDLRDEERLYAALARPRFYAHYRQADIALQAAAYIHGIAEGQGFLDGNKRTAEAAGVFFLLDNGYLIDPAIEAGLADWILDLSEGLTVEEFADLLRPWLIRVR